VPERVLVKVNGQDLMGLARGEHGTGRFCGRDKVSGSEERKEETERQDTVLREHGGDLKDVKLWKERQTMYMTTEHKARIQRQTHERTVRDYIL
jgi:hypothetical protein